MSSHRPAQHLEEKKEIVWEEVHRLSKTYAKANLGRGSPEEGVHHGVLQELSRIVSDPDKNCELHQYTQVNGHPRLLEALAKFYSPLYQRKLDPWKEILVTCGASHAIFCSFMGILNPGDEVIIIEPFYELYPSVVKQARGTPVFVSLKPKSRSVSSADWELDVEELESKITPKTKMILLNTPHNPLGKVFTKPELEDIAGVAIKHDLIVLMDEVYEFLVYKGSNHVKMATLPEMRERTITVGSSGKAFSVTGWKIGWAVAPPNLHKCLTLVHQDCTRVCATPLQEALAVGFEQEEKLLGTSSSYWHQLCGSLEAKRDLLASYLSSVGLNPNIPQATYFMVVNITDFASKVNLEAVAGEAKDVTFYKWLCKTKGLLGVPMSAFYSTENKHLGEKYIRFCFIKKNSTLDSARSILQEIKSQYY